MLIRNQQKKDENFGKKYEKLQVKERARPGEKKDKELKAYKAHCAELSTKFNHDQRLDRDHEDVSGVSPIRHRHNVDLYGVKNGLGKFNPIMVENINKIPDIYDYAAPEVVKEFNQDKSRSRSRSPSGKRSIVPYDKSHKKGNLMLQSFDVIPRESPGKIGGQMHWQIDRTNKSPGDL